MAYEHYIADGQKNIPLNSLPKEAWTYITGGEGDGDDVESRYNAVGWLYRCVNLRAAALSDLPWDLSRGDTVVWSSDEEDTPDEYAWLDDLPELLYLTESAMIAGGQAFWEHARNRMGNQHNLGWLAPFTMKAKWDRDQGLVGFERKLGTRRIMLKPEEVIYFRLPNPFHETKPGQAPAAAALQAANVLYNVDKFAEMFFQRGAIKATLLTIQGNPPQAEREKIKSWWRRMFSGMNNAFNEGVVNAEAVTPVIVGEGLSELSNEKLTTERREEISTTMGIPHSLVASNAANFATAEQDKRNFYDSTVLPAATLHARTINRQLLNPLGLRLTFKPQRMTIYQEDEEQRATALSQYVSAGIPLPVAAEMLGLDLPDGIEYADLETPEPEPMTVLPPAQPRQLPAPAVDAERSEEVRRFRRWAKKRLPDVDADEFASDLLTGADKAAIVATIQEDGDAEGSPFPGADTHKAMILQLDPDDDEAEQAARMMLERRLRRRLNGSLSSQRRRVMESLVGVDGQSFEAWAATDLEKAIVGARHYLPSQEFDYIDEDELYDVLRQTLRESADLGVSVAVDQFESVGFGFDWSMTNTSARDWANQYAGDLFTGINDTSRRQVRQAVTEWIANSEPLSALENELMGTFSQRRAELIASTEVTRAFAEGNRRAYQDSGVVRLWEWRTAQDERVCPICGPLHKRQLPMGSTFSSILDEPRLAGFDAPPAHPRCRCWMVPVIDA